MWKIAVSSDLSGAPLDLLRDDPGVQVSVYDSPAGLPQLLNELQQADAVVCSLSESMNAEVFAASARLKVIANLAVGYDNVDVQSATKSGILLLNTPGVLDNATADLAFALLMACARRVVEADSFVRAGKWRGWEADLFLGSDITGKTLGIVGLGRIGQAMARRGRGFDMKIVYAGPRRKPPEIESQVQAEYLSLDELLAVSDFVSLHCPLNAETRQLIGGKQLELLKPQAVLINTARGAIIDQPALLAALEQGKLQAAGLDVFVDEPAVPESLKSMPKVVLTPHIGSATVETRQAMSQLAVSGLLDALSGKRPSNLVNSEAWEVFKARLAGG